jgi:hypothetical protein
MGVYAGVETPTSLRKNHSSGAKAHIYFVAFAAIMAKAMTYQSCPFETST